MEPVTRLHVLAVAEVGAIGLVLCPWDGAEETPGPLDYGGVGRGCDAGGLEA